MSRSEVVRLQARGKRQRKTSPGSSQSCIESDPPPWKLVERKTGDSTGWEYRHAPKSSGNHCRQKGAICYLHPLMGVGLRGTLVPLLPEKADHRRVLPDHWKVLTPSRLRVTVWFPEGKKDLSQPKPSHRRKIEEDIGRIRLTSRRTRKGSHLLSRVVGRGGSYR